MGRAYSVTEILKQTYDTLQWRPEWVEAFDRPETTGIWSVKGKSTNGKGGFQMQLAKELSLCKMGKVLLNETEEGVRKTLQDSLITHGLEEVKQWVKVTNESIKELDERLSKRKSPRVVFVNSVQSSGITKSQFDMLREKYQYKKLLIFFSQVEGNEPKGKVAQHIEFMADQKIDIQGFKAFSKGRYKAGGVFTIWEEGANKFWGANNDK